MNVLHRYRYALAVIVLLAVFAGIKAPSLSLPYFWDELGVYSQAALYLHDHGTSLMPGDCDPDLSRGHPPLYCFLVSLAFDLFGPTVVVGHLFNLLVSMVTIGAIYRFGRRFFSKRVGLTAAIVFTFQPIFLAQSVFVLPEVMLTLWGLLAFHFFFAEKYGRYVLFASCALLTKETALLLPGALALAAFVQHREGDGFSWKTRVSAAVKPLLPLVTLAAFLVVQRIQNGWFLFPYHTGLISFSPADLISRFYRGSCFLLVLQGRFWFVVLFAAVVIRKRFPRLDPVQKSVFRAFLCFIGVMILFSTINYHMNRYYLFILPPVVLLFSRLFWSRIFPTPIRRAVFGILLVLSTSPFVFVFWRFNTDFDLSYRISLDSLQRSIRYLDDRTAGRDPVKVCARFPAINALRDTRQGYVRDDRYIVSTEMDDYVDFVIEADPGDPLDIPSSYSLRMIFEDTRYYAVTRIYEVKKPD